MARLNYTRDTTPSHDPLRKLYYLLIYLIVLHLVGSKCWWTWHAHSVNELDTRARTWLLPARLTFNHIFSFSCLSVHLFICLSIHWCFYLDQVPDEVCGVFAGNSSQITTLLFLCLFLYRHSFRSWSWLISRSICLQQKTALLLALRFNLNLHVYMFYMYIYIHMYIHIYLYIYLSMYLYIPIYLCIMIDIYVHICIYMYFYI